MVLNRLSVRLGRYFQVQFNVPTFIHFKSNKRMYVYADYMFIQPLISFKSCLKPDSTVKTILKCKTAHSLNDLAEYHLRNLMQILQLNNFRVVVFRQ